MWGGRLPGRGPGTEGRVPGGAAGRYARVLEARLKLAPLAVLAVAVTLSCGRPARPDGGFGLLDVGAIAPEVVGRDASGVDVRLSDQHGHPTVVYFYPADGTPGCTAEACAFRDVWTKYTQAHVAVMGVSTNSEQRHAEFLRDEKLPFALASDEEGKVAAAYGVRKSFIGFQRVTFLVDGEGRIAHVWDDVDPGVHASEVLAVASTLH
jgi:thioredoxin-dependent peroxiredoxin